MEVATPYLVLFAKSFIRSKPPGRRLVTSDIHLLQVSTNHRMIIEMVTSGTSFQKHINIKWLIFVSPSSGACHSKEPEQNMTQVLAFGWNKSPEQANAIQLIMLSLTLPMAARALFGSLPFNITFIATECFKVTSYRVVVLAKKISWVGKVQKTMQGNLLAPTMVSIDLCFN